MVISLAGAQYWWNILDSVEEHWDLCKKQEVVNGPSNDASIKKRGSRGSWYIQESWFQVSKAVIGNKEFIESLMIGCLGLDQRKLVSQHRFKRSI